MFESKKISRNVLFFAVLLGLAASSPARAASVQITDANGNLYEFEGENIPCCDDWGLAGGSSCIDDCIIASTDTPVTPLVDMLMVVMRAASEGTLFDDQDKKQINKLISENLSRHGTSAKAVGLDLNTTKLFVENANKELRPLVQTKAETTSAQACHYWLFFFVSCTEAVEGMTVAECDAELEDLGLDDWWCQTPGINGGGGDDNDDPRPPQYIAAEKLR